MFQSAEAGHQCKKCGFLLTEEMCSIVDDLPTLEKKISIDIIAALICIAGHVIRKEKQTEDTYFLYEKYGGYTSELNRGGLAKPDDSVSQWVIYSYIIFQTVADHSCRKSLCNLLMVVSELYNLNMDM